MLKRVTCWLFGHQMDMEEFVSISKDVNSDPEVFKSIVMECKRCGGINFIYRFENYKDMITLHK